MDVMLVADAGMTTEGRQRGSKRYSLHREWVVVVLEGGL